VDRLCPLTGTNRTVGGRPWGPVSGTAGANEKVPELSSFWGAIISNCRLSSVG